MCLNFCRKSNIKGNVCFLSRIKSKKSSVEIFKLLYRKEIWNCCTVTVSVLKTRLFIIEVYNLPTNEIDLFFDKFLECVEQSKLNEITIIFSDFNIDFMK